MWKLTDPERAGEMKEKLLSMKHKVDELLNIEVGVNESQHGSAYDIVFIGTFLDRDALRRFESDEYHKEVGSFVASVRVDRKVVEFEC
tara:strand:+ start:143 stop:406 length:264 start_codon:yes stop_codon:yes gene_type:complete